MNYFSPLLLRFHCLHSWSVAPGLFFTSLVVSAVLSSRVSCLPACARPPLYPPMSLFVVLCARADRSRVELCMRGLWDSSLLPPPLHRANKVFSPTTVCLFPYRLYGMQILHHTRSCLPFHCPSLWSDTYYALACLLYAVFAFTLALIIAICRCGLCGIWSMYSASYVFLFCVFVCWWHVFSREHPLGISP